jgi:hypothetical protein
MEPVWSVYAMVLALSGLDPRKDPDFEIILGGIWNFTKSHMSFIG